MQVAGDLARRAGDGLVAQHERAERELLDDLAADRGRQRPVVVAGDPDPAPAVLQRGERGAVVGGEPLGPVEIVEAVAERDHGRGPVARRSPAASGASVSRVS